MSFSKGICSQPLSPGMVPGLGRQQCCLQVSEISIPGRYCLPYPAHFVTRLQPRAEKAKLHLVLQTLATHSSCHSWGLLLPCAAASYCLPITPKADVSVPLPEALHLLSLPHRLFQFCLNSFQQ